MGKKKIVVDTNTLISAVGWAGNPNELFSRIMSGDYHLYISPATFAEFKRVLDYPKFGFTPAQKATFIGIVAAVGIMVEPKETINVITADPSDNRFLECAIAANADVLISGDQHLLSLKTYHGISILTVAAFLHQKE